MAGISPPSYIFRLYIICRKYTQLTNIMNLFFRKNPLIL
nr:MAG TPA: hypothetical protein [Caudoviricetes sp.]